MKNDLIDRYIYAVTKRMNHRIRDDVQKELYALVEDMLTERCGNAAPAEKDIRIVLTELGTPQELYAKYDENSGRSLIGPPYYGTYKLVTGIVLACVALGMTVSSLIIHFVEAQLWYETLLSWISMMWSGCLQGFAIVTILFAFFCRRGVQLGEPFNFDNLPPVPKRTEQISRWECVFSIAFCVIFLVLFLAAPQYIFGYWGAEKIIPLFDVDVLQGCWYLILIYGVLDIVRETVRLLERQYNRKVMLTTLVTNSLSVVVAVLWLTKPNLINGEFITHIEQIMEGDAAFIAEVFVNFQFFFLGIILFALVLDTVEAIVKTLKK